MTIWNVIYLIRCSLIYIINILMRFFRLSAGESRIKCPTHFSDIFNWIWYLK